MKLFSIRRGLVLALLAAIPGCGGGSTPSIPSATTQPAPQVPTPTPSPYPSTHGDAFIYKGSISQTFTRLATPAPSPSPGATPQPTSTPWIGTLSTAVSQNVTINGNATFQGTSGLTDFETKETDTGTNATTTSDTHEYLSFQKNADRWNGIDLMEVGSVSADSGGVSITTAYGSGNGLMDQLPEVPQAQWTNTAARTVTENDPSGESLTNTYAADGTYTGGAQFPNGTTSSILENGDGSGIYVMPLVDAGADSSMAFSAPQNGMIGISFDDNADRPTRVLTTSIPAWFAMPPVFASDATVDAGSVTIPSSCNIATSLATQATRLDETRTRLDVVFGEVETLKQSFYVAPPYGVVCLVAHDTLVDYYDWSGQSSFLSGFTAGAPYQQTDTTETLGMQNATLAESSARRAQSVTASAPMFAHPSLARLELSAAKRRLMLVHHLSAALRKPL